MNILDIAIVKKLAGGGGGSGTDNYNDLSNLPKINDTTLSGNKSSSALGLQSEINSDSKLASDLVDDTNQDNKFVTSTEKNTWNAKQNAIDSDHKLSSDLVDDANKTNKFVTSTEKNTWNAKQNAIDSDHKLSSDLVDDANKTNKFVTSTEKNTWNAKQNAIDADHKLSSSLVSFTTAEAAALASGIDGTKVGQISTNQSNILYTLGKTGHNLLEVTATSETVSGVEYTVNKNTITISSNGSNTTSTFVLNSGSPLFKASNNVFAIDKVMPAGATITVRYTDGSLVGFNSGNRNTNATLNNSKDVESIYLYIDANKTINDTIKVMVCTQDDWEVTHEITPYQGAPNYDLTRLEAEDRAALAEDIDSGAKNKFNPANIAELRHLATNGSDYAYVSTSTDTRTKCNFSVFSWNGNTKIDQLTKVDVTANGNIALIFTKQASYNKISFGHSGQAKDLMIFYNVSDLVNGQTYVLSVNITQFNPSVTNFAFSDVLLCTKAAFGVSQKFVPYRMPYDTLGRLKWKSYEIDLKSVTFTKSAGGAFYYLFSVSSDFSNIIAVNLESFSYLPNKGYTARMNQSNLTVGVMVYDATDPQTLTFSDGQLWILVLGFS